MNKSELEHVWRSVTSVLENEFRTRGWLPPQAAHIEALDAALREIGDFPYIGEKAAQQMALIARAARAEGHDK